MLKNPCLYGMANLLHQLQVKGLPCRWMELYDHKPKCTTDMVQMYRYKWRPHGWIWRRVLYGLLGR